MTNHYRKNWTVSEIVAIKKSNRTLQQRQKAKERQKVLNNEETAGENFSQADTRKSRDEVADFVGVSYKTLQKAEEIVTAAEQKEPEKYLYLCKTITLLFLNLFYNFSFSFLSKGVIFSIIILSKLFSSKSIVKSK